MIEIQKGNELEQSEEEKKESENALATINFALGICSFTRQEIIIQIGLQKAWMIKKSCTRKQ